LSADNKKRKMGNCFPRPSPLYCWKSAHRIWTGCLARHPMAYRKILGLLLMLLCPMISSSANNEWRERRSDDQFDETSWPRPYWSGRGNKRKAHLLQLAERNLLKYIIAPVSLIVRSFPLVFPTTKENRAGWPGFYASSRDAVTSKRGADWRRCARRFRSGFCIASRQEKSEEERGNSTFPGARPGPNHNL